MTVEGLLCEIEVCHKELNRAKEWDKDFPLVMRIKGLVDNYLALRERFEEMECLVDEYQWCLGDE